MCIEFNYMKHINCYNMYHNRNVNYISQQVNQLPEVNKQRNLLNTVYVYNYYLFSINVPLALQKIINIAVNLMESVIKYITMLDFKQKEANYYTQHRLPSSAYIFTVDTSKDVSQDTNR